MSRGREKAGRTSPGMPGRGQKPGPWGRADGQCFGARRTKEERRKNGRATRGGTCESRKGVGTKRYRPQEASDGLWQGSHGSDLLLGGRQVGRTGLGLVPC